MLQEEFLKPLGLTAYRLAKDIGVPLTRIDYIVAGKRAVTAETQTVGSLTAPPKKQERPSRAFAFRGGQGGIRTRGGLLTHTRFPGVRLKPLIHLSTAEPAMLPLGPHGALWTQRFKLRAIPVA